MAAPVAAAAAGSAAKSSVFSNLANSFAASAGSQIGSGIGGVLGYGIGEIFGHNKRARRQQLEQQDKLNALSFQWNKRQMDYAQQLEKQMYQFTFDMNKPEALKNLYKEAGLNPALMYGTSAGGVQGTSVGGGRGAGYNSQAANEAEIIQSNLALQEMGLQMAKLQSEIDVNKSIAEKNKADAGLSSSKTKTEDQVRDAFIANIYYEGKTKWLEYVMRELKLTYGDSQGKIKGVDYKIHYYHDTMDIYGAIGIPENLKYTIFGDELLSAIDASKALTGNHIANTALTNEKTKYLYLEILADIAAKESQAALNKAKELESKWQIGEHVNWKTILDSSVDALNTIMKVLMSTAGM